MAQNDIPVSEVYWSLVEKAERKFSRIRDLPPYGKNRYDMYFHKVFRIYTQLWKFQQENRQKLVEAGLNRWEVGEIASRIAQLYYGQYLRTSEVNFLSESYIFYEAIMMREYFKEGPPSQELKLAGKQLRYLARFMIVCLVLNRREMAYQLVNHLRMLVDECKRNLPDMDFKDWKQIVQEIVRFLKADNSFMNIRPLRYSLVLDPNPDSLPYVACVAKRGLKLQEAILTSYRHNEVKFTELTLDTFRMLQCLEWEPSGSFYQTKVADLSLNGPSISQNGGSGPNRNTFSQEITDPTLPLNPRKAILYRPTVTHFIAETCVIKHAIGIVMENDQNLSKVLATICEELPHQGILLIYLSASGLVSYLEESCVSLCSSPGSYTIKIFAGKGGQGSPSSSTENVMESFQSLEMATDKQSSLPLSSDGPANSSVQSKGIHKSISGDGLWLGSRGSGVILVMNSRQAIHGEEKGETAAMLLSPCFPAPSTNASVDSSRHQNGSQFTMFLTAPLQAFCHLIGYSGSNVDMATSDFLHPIWAEVLSDPFLRRLLLRFIFCRAALALFAQSFDKNECHPECLPHLPDSVLPSSAACQSAIQRLARIFSASRHFVYSCVIVPSGNESCDGESPLIKASDIHEEHFAAENGH
ncbi:hypothetical protein ACLOJK_033878 [Asimina triloba]